MAKDSPGIMDTLLQTRQVAAAIVDGAEGYIEIMRNAPPVKVEIGGFYQTFDGSVVYVANNLTGCRCPICMGAMGGPSNTIFGSILSNMMGMQVQVAQAEGEAGDTEEDSAAVEVEPHDPEKVIDTFVVVVLKGGHGIAALRGEKPGESYLADKTGTAILMKLDGKANTEARKTHVDKSILAIAGMTLKRRLKATISME